MSLDTWMKWEDLSKAVTWCWARHGSPIKAGMMLIGESRSAVHGLNRPRHSVTCFSLSALAWATSAVLWALVFRCWVGLLCYIRLQKRDMQHVLTHSTGREALEKSVTWDTVRSSSKDLRLESCLS